MKIRIYDFWIDIILLMGVGVPLIFGGVLDTWRTIMTITIIAVTIIFVSTHRLKKNGSSRFLLFYILLVLAIVLYEIIKASKAFSYSTYEIFYASRQYLWIILAIPLTHVISSGQSVDRHLKRISNIVLLSLGLRTFTWFCGNYLGITVFHTLFYEYGNSWGRGGKQRIDATALIGVLIPLLFYLYQKSKNTKCFTTLCFVFVYLVLVSQTRTLILGFAVCILAMIFFEKRSSLKKLLFQLSLILIFSVAVNLGAIDYILGKMNISLSDGSIGYRFYEYKYYSTFLDDGRWKTGLGIITTLNSQGERLLFGNLDTKMYLDDLGIFECFFQFGMFTLFLYGALIIYLLYVMKKCRQEGDNTFSIYLIGQLFYILTVSLPLDLFGVQRSFSIPVILAISCTIHHTIEKQIKAKKYVHEEYVNESSQEKSRQKRNMVVSASGL